MYSNLMSHSLFPDCLHSCFIHIYPSNLRAGDVVNDSHGVVLISDYVTICSFVRNLAITGVEHFLFFA